MLPNRVLKETRYVEFGNEGTCQLKGDPERPLVGEEGIRSGSAGRSTALYRMARNQHVRKACEAHDTL